MAKNTAVRLPVITLRNQPAIVLAGAASTALRIAPAELIRPL